MGEGHQHPGQHVRVRVETGAVDKTGGRDFCGRDDRKKRTSDDQQGPPVQHRELYSKSM